MGLALSAPRCTSLPDHAVALAAVGEMLACVDIANNTGEPVLHKQSCVTQGPAVCTQVVEHKWCWLSHRVYGRLVLHRVEDIVHRSGNTGCVGDIQRNLCYTGATQGFLTYTGTKPKTAISTQCRLRWHAVAPAYAPCPTMMIYHDDGPAGMDLHSVLSPQLRRDPQSQA